MRRLSKAAAGPRDALADSVRRIRQLRILALKKELEDRLANAAKLATDGDAAEGRPWRNILADLNSLTGTEGEQDGKRFLLRSAPPPASSRAPPASLRRPTSGASPKTGPDPPSNRTWRQGALPERILRINQCLGVSRR
jgi:hypothetical protein